MSGPPTRDGYRNRKVLVPSGVPGQIATYQTQKRPARVPYEEMRDLSVQKAIAKALRKQE